MTALRSSLSRLQAQQPLDKLELDRLATRAWHELGILVVKPEGLRSDILRRGAETIGDQIYGRRRESKERGR